MPLRLDAGERHYRAEIVQLRAIAVLSVLLFHLRIPGFQGGYIGVDIFFVISGYLITRNILRDTERGSFSFGAFYLRRLRRIYPALIITVLMTYLVAAVWSAPLLFLDIAKECTHALLSIANIQYWREASHYFAPKSDDLVLLHTWSLSVEEQFYLVWPALLVLALRAGVLRTVVLLASVSSFAATAVVRPVDSSAVFFLMPFRIFEFGCGALIIFAGASRPGMARELVATGGLTAIIASALLLRSDMSRQELLVLLPCIGATAVIWAGEHTVASRALRIPGLTAIGTISYSLYLCHWPIIFYARFVFGEAANSTVGTVAMLASMFLVASSMYSLVERRFIAAEAAPSRQWKSLARYGAGLLAVVALTHWTFLSKGFAWRMPASVLAAGWLDSPATSDSIKVPVSAPPTIDLVGDSHAGMYATGLLPLVQSAGSSLEYVGEAGCPILMDVSIRARRRADCVRSRDGSLEALKTRGGPLIFVQSWETYDDAYLEYDRPGSWPDKSGSLTKLEDALYRTLSIWAQNRHVLLIGAQVPASCEINRARLLQGPLPHAPPHPCAPTARINAENAGAAVNAMLARVQSRFPGRVELIRPADYLCDEVCPVFHEDRWLYWDATHFTQAGSIYMVERTSVPLRKFMLQVPTRTSVGGLVEN